MNTIENYLYSDLTGIIIKAYYNVYNKLDYGFLEKVYENALIIELEKLNLKCEKQKAIKVYYDEVNVGEYFADLIVNDLVIIELKAADSLAEEHEAQLVNYLRATDIEIGLLLNFGRVAQFKRKAFSNKFKNHNLAKN
ncbi:MAG: GxxExxY protein [Bacteroidota bacterium]|jgi:GxxExxY protein|nr:GxxExxY protein [Bacteroidota bacterium]